MYDDDDDWPFKCPDCGEEFTKKIGWLKTQTEVKCPGVLNPLGPIPCPHTLTDNHGEFPHALAEAKAGRLDPWASWLRRPPPRR
jgi:hypothetical protein